MTTLTTQSHRTVFRHEMLTCSGASGFVTSARPLVDSAVTGGCDVVVVADGTRLDALDGAMSDRAGAVTMFDMSDIGRNPGRIISHWWRHLGQAQARGVGLLVVCEPVFSGRDADAVDECVIHEQLVHHAFADQRGFRLVCAYDVQLDPRILAQAEQAHPAVLDGACTRARRPFTPERSHSLLTAPLSARPSHAVCVEFDLGNLDSLRAEVATRASACGLSRGRAADLVLAVSEIAANSTVHGAGEGQLWWWTNGVEMTCEIQDRGQLDDPLVGRRPPTLDQQGGRGVWIAHELCDLVQIRSIGSATVVRLRMGR